MKFIRACASLYVMFNTIFWRNKLKRIFLLIFSLFLAGCDGGRSSYDSFAKACYAEASPLCNKRFNRHSEGYELHACLDRYACSCLRRNGFEGDMCVAPGSNYMR